jgi:hypothetical protein
VQEKELYKHQEQKNHNRAVGVEEVLPLLPQASSPQGDKVKGTLELAAE